MKTLKRVCVFYLDRWWLPLLCVWVWGLLSMWLTINIGPFLQSGNNDVLLVFFITFIVELGIFVWLGVAFSWGWLLFHKRWREFALNFGVTLIFMFFFHTMFFILLPLFPIAFLFLLSLCIIRLFRKPSPAP